MERKLPAPNRRRSLISPFFTSGSSALTTYSLSSSLMSTNGDHSAVVSGSRSPPSVLDQGCIHEENRFSKSWSSFRGFHRLSVLRGFVRVSMFMVLVFVWFCL